MTLAVHDIQKAGVPCQPSRNRHNTLHGKSVVHLTRGVDDLHFYYDAQGKPAVVIFNGTAYGYLYNLQGDVVALVDGTGAKVVEYSYDAWGKPISKTGTMAATLGTVQPFRYRGYVFDEETGDYYLRSRYYRAEWGRFVSADSLIQDNLFSYCNNSPIICSDNDGTLTEVIINGKVFIGEYYGLNKRLAAAINIILADDEMFAYSKCIGRDEKGKRVYRYGSIGIRERYELTVYIWLLDYMVEQKRYQGAGERQLG